jgi:hypothetical protein|tara:strand:- start:575 stop:1114 length:540 start_codon:yes stop_codon:yes gene_type:complete
MKVELLKLLAAKSMNLEMPSKHHNAITPEDILHFLSMKNLTSEEYDILIAKYTDNGYSRGMLQHDLYEDACKIFLKHIDPKILSKSRFTVRAFVTLAIKEIVDTKCPFCKGRGFIADIHKITKCEHCDDQGNFIYDDTNRPELMNMRKDDYDFYKEAYLEFLQKVKDIEISALSKIGDA